MNQLNSQLIEGIFTLTRMMKEHMHNKSDLVHLSMVQVQAMIFLKKQPESTMNEIASHFHIELPSATSLVNKLVKAKLAKRVTDKKDRRIVRVTLTAHGKQLLEEAMKERSEKMRQLLSHLDTTEKEHLLKITDKLIATIKESHEK